MAAGQQPGTRDGAAQCLLRLARASEIDCPPVAQPAEPPGTDPYAGWCNRESGRPPTYVYCRSTTVESTFAEQAASSALAAMAQMARASAARTLTPISQKRFGGGIALYFQPTEPAEVEQGRTAQRAMDGVRRWRAPQATPLLPRTMPGVEGRAVRAV